MNNKLKETMKFTEAIQKNKQEKVLKLAKENNACAEEYKVFYKAKTKKERVNIVCRNLGWLYKNNIIHIIDLPDNLSVGGYLDLRGTKITSLPDNLSVGGYLDLEGTKITSLPDNLNVGGSLYLGGTKITSLPDNLKVKGEIYKDF
jgi:hypothetical protein